MSDTSNQRRQLEQLEAFCTTDAYRSYLTTFKADIYDVEQNILNTIPTDQESLAHLLQLHGRRTELQSSLTFFESSQAALKEQIAAAEDAETQEPDNNESEIV